MQESSFMRYAGLCTIGLVAGVALMLGIDVSESQAQDDENAVPFSVANIFFELNNSDGDLGIHALIDGEPWRKLEIEDPRGYEIFDLHLDGRLRRQGLTELFFESAEPTFDELTPEMFFRRFPEGIYEIEGVALDGFKLKSTAILTHLIPAPPGGITVSGVAIDPEAVDCDEGPIPVVNRPIVIQWDPVTLSHPVLGNPTSSPTIEVVAYQVVVERDDDERPLIQSTFDLPPGVTRVSVPLAPVDNQFKLEILVREVSGNQTAIETCFEVAAP